jgi:hypothetical protein
LCESMDSGLCFLCMKVWILAYVSCVAKAWILLYGLCFLMFENMDSGLCFLAWILVCGSCLEKCGFWSVFLSWESMDSGLCFLCVKVWILVSVSCV